MEKFDQFSHTGSVKYAAIDSHGEIMATTGCDCLLKICEITKDKKLLKSTKISKKASVALGASE